MARFSVRITRFSDQGSFQSVVAFLARLYPDRDRQDFETGLARLPCTLSDDADGAAARALERALRERGADVRLLPLDSEGGQSVVASTQELSPEIDLNFLNKARRRKKAGPSTTDSSPMPGWGQDGGAAPWED